MRQLLRWLNERTGYQKVWDALFARKLPEAKGINGWFYTLGSATLFVFLVQIMTGCLLAMSYVPSPDHAFDSVRYITETEFLGHFLRGVHKWGSSFMVVLVSLHMLRVFLMGAYKYPREITWMTGVVLFVLVMMLGFTGYLLPWDQKAFWATAVGTTMAAQTPIVGPYINALFRGGSEMGAATLTRFYSWHALMFPLLLGLFIGIHLFLVVWHGISEPPERRRR